VLPLQYGDPAAWPVSIARVRCFGAWRDGSKAVRKLRMSQQPEIMSPVFPASPAQEPGPGQPSERTSLATGVPDPLASDHDSHGRHRIPRWLERAEMFLRVLLRMYIGLAVCYAPWSRLFWDQNPLFLRFPTLSIYAANGAVRGLISGLGLLNLWIAFHDAVRHRKDDQ
jgi:hypothetical protein